MCEYIKAYAAHFDLMRDVRLNTSVQWIERNAEDTKWRVCTCHEGKEEICEFDRIAVCNGLSSKAVTPDFEGVEKFKGKMMHVQSFRRYTSSYVIQ